MDLNLHQHLKRELQKIQLLTISNQELEKIFKQVQDSNNCIIVKKVDPKQRPGIDLQCLHFKSLKCPYRIRFNFIEKSNGQSHFALRDYRLEHQYHKEYTQEDKQLLQIKQEIEDKRELIKNVFLGLSPSKGNWATPLSVVQFLKQHLDFDIYHNIQNVSMRKLIKKKLDNTIRDFKEEISKMKQDIPLQEQSSYQSNSFNSRSDQHPPQDEWENYINFDQNQKQLHCPSDLVFESDFI